METGTLEQIGAMDGDKVFCISNIIDSEINHRYSMFTPGQCYTFASRGMIGDKDAVWPGVHPYCGVWRIISRAAQPALDLTAITTPFGLLDEATQEALRAHGGPFQCYGVLGEWFDIESVSWQPSCAYRAKPAPVVETVTDDRWLIPHNGNISFGEMTDRTPVRVTFNRINGVIDLASYKVEPR